MRARHLTSSTRRTSYVSIVAVSLGALLVAAAPAMAQGVPYGAPKEDFIAALADMDPVEMVMQSVSSPGNANSLPTERYAAAVEEWSGGKITVKIVYGSAIMQGNTAPAIADGRITYGGVIAQYDPSNLPTSAALVDLTFASNALPFAGVLQSWGMMLETGNANERAWEEQRDYGVEPGFIVSGVNPSGLFCREPRSTLADLKGVQTRTGGVMHARQIEGIGAANVSLPYSEMFEGLQRGIIDCALTNLSTAVVAGIIPVAPYHTTVRDHNFALTATNVAFDQVFWEEIPLEARQLLYDLQKVYIDASIRTLYLGAQEGLQIAASSGGKVEVMDEAANDQLASVNDELLNDLRQSPYFDDGNAVVDTLLAASTKWDGIVEELGYTAMDPGWPTFGTWYDDAAVDLTPYIDRLYQETMLPYRPE